MTLGNFRTFTVRRKQRFHRLLRTSAPHVTRPFSTQQNRLVSIPTCLNCASKSTRAFRKSNIGSMPISESFLSRNLLPFCLIARLHREIGHSQLMSKEEKLTSGPLGIGGS